MKKPVFTVILAGWALLCASGFAHAAAQGAFNDQPASPRSLPADNLPPFGMLDDRGQLVPTPVIPAAALASRRTSVPESTARGPSLSVAIQAAQAALRSCVTDGYPNVGVAVIDSAGEARALLTADGSDGSHVFVAMRKALAALAFGKPSSEVSQAATQDASLLKQITPAMFVEGGAVPIMSGNEVVGAIGVSGAGGTRIGQQDEACAAAGLRKISRKIR